MTREENSLESLMAEADRRGKELVELEKRNKKRKAKGRKPLPDPDVVRDKAVLKRNYRTGDATTVDGADALKLLQIRRDEMDEEKGLDIAALEAEADHPDEAIPPPKPAKPDPYQDIDAEAMSRAIKQAEAARRVQDMKNGRIDHEGNWSESGQKLEGGDPTLLPSRVEGVGDDASRAWDTPADSRPPAPAKRTFGEVPEPPPGADPKAFADGYLLEKFRLDLYERMRVSFDALERSLSDLQGRVSEIVTATTPPVPGPGPSEEETQKESKYAQFEALLSQKTPVTFEVAGTRMTFDAICVFKSPPCLTVVSKIGSATIAPQPGAKLKLSYDLDGVRMEDDLVTYLGTRFDLPMFGLSFVGFIRDAECGDVEG